MFEPQFCIIDLFGHTKIAGMVSEQEIGGSSFVRVDVPECDGQKAFTRFFGPGAIYAIQPVDQETGLAAVKSFQVRPIDLWTIQDFIRKLPARVDVDEEMEDIGILADREYAMHKDDLPDLDEIGPDDDDT